MRRRDFIKRIAGSAASWPFAGRAQQPAMPAVGFLSDGSSDSYIPRVAAFRQGLGEAGYIEGRNATVEYRWANGHSDRLPSLAAELVSHQVAVIAATTGGVPAVFVGRRSRPNGAAPVRD